MQAIVRRHTVVRIRFGMVAVAGQPQGILVTCILGLVRRRSGTFHVACAHRVKRPQSVCFAER